MSDVAYYLMWPAGLALVAVTFHFFLGWDGLAGLKNWYDPWFMSFNVIMGATAIVLPLGIVVSYVYTMRDEKEWRLRQQLGTRWDACRETAVERLDRDFSFSNYQGSVATSMLIVLFGVGTILIMRPVIAGGAGVDLGKGANMLMLGAYARDLAHPEKYATQLFINLSAFQFGFLGAWIYFINQLVRSFFTCDLTPRILVAGNIRMITGSILALVIAFALPVSLGSTDAAAAGDTQLMHYVPLIGFFIGYFPERGLLYLRKLVANYAMGLAQPERSNSAALATLSGVSYTHELRLGWEGYDNVENLAQADPVDLTLRTGFPYRQTSQWIGEAWLRAHLGASFDAFREKSGITSSFELGELLRRGGAEHRAANEAMVEATLGDAALWSRVKILGDLLAPPTSGAAHARGAA